MYKIYYGYAQLFLKKDKYTLGATCEKYIIAILEIFLETAYLPKDKKLTLLQQANNKLEALKIFIRILWELNIIDQKKYLNLQMPAQEIGKMFGGWIKSLSIR